MFKNRQDAGKQLGEKIKSELGKEYLDDAVIIGIPRGGVVTAKVVSDVLKLEFSAIVVKKIGAPENPELAVGAVSSGGFVYWNEEIIKSLGLTKQEKERLRKEKEKEVKEREVYLNITLPKLEKKVVIVVDDGVATGSTVIAASRLAKKMKAQKTVLATPLIAQDILRRMTRYFDQIVFLEKPETFYAVGEFYEEFGEVSDQEVKEILKIKHKI